MTGDTEMGKIAVIVHGGAGRIPDSEAGEYRAATIAAVRAARAVLAGGGSALDAAIAAVQSMEDAPMLNAGYGAVLDENGELSFDASVMEGGAMSAGAIAAIPGNVRSPVALARLVMEKHPSVLLACEGAISFAKSQGIETIDPESMITERQRERWRQWKSRSEQVQLAANGNDNGEKYVSPTAPGQPEAEDIDAYNELVTKPDISNGNGNGNGKNGSAHKNSIKNGGANKVGAHFVDPVSQDSTVGDTVGAVVRDSTGWIVSALSTGGVRGKPKGRVGDTPLIGCGLYAMDELGGAAATGIGEDIIRSMLSGRAVTAIEAAGGAQGAAESAVRFMLDRINGMAGVVMLDANGDIGYAHSTMRMAVAYWSEGMAEPVADLDGNLIE
jgi:beta-aspartyl-peptidase (threonine type)